MILDLLRQRKAEADKALDTAEQLESRLTELQKQIGEGEKRLAQLEPMIASGREILAKLSREISQAEHRLVGLDAQARTEESEAFAQAAVAGAVLAAGDGTLANAYLKRHGWTPGEWGLRHPDRFSGTWQRQAGALEAQARADTALVLEHVRKRLLLQFHTGEFSKSATELLKP